MPSTTRFGATRRGVALAGLCVTLSGACAAGEPLHLLYDLRPPLLTLEHGQLGGALGGRAQLALTQAGVVFDLENTPIARQDAELKNGKTAVCAIGRLRSPERARYGVFSEPILVGPRYVAIVRSDAPVPAFSSLHTWAATPALRWGVQRGLYYSDQIHAEIEQARAEIVYFSRSNQDFDDLLLASRADFTLMQEDEAALLLADEANRSLRSVPLQDMTTGESRYFYCSKAVAASTLEALNKALRGLPPPTSASAQRIKP